METTLNKSFFELDFDTICTIEGGTLWGKVGGVAATIGGVAEVVGGVALLVTPEPTGLTKVGGWASVTTGVGTIVGGIATVANN